MCLGSDVGRTRWRLSPTTDEDRYWRVMELELYADSKNRLPTAGLEGGGETVLSSSYLPLITGFRRSEKGPMWSEAQQCLGPRSRIPQRRGPATPVGWPRC
eukprot:Skav216623  [mRNA]  locus=scaffold3008:218312:219536:- [translate_table: standard]